MTDPPRVYPSTLGFGRRIRRRYIAPVTEQGQPAREGVPLAAMGFVRRPTVQVTGLGTPSIASRVIERPVQPALPVSTTTASPAARDTGSVVAPSRAPAQWPQEPTQDTVEPVVPFVAVAPEPPAAQAAPAGEAPLRGFTLDEVRRALQRPARTQPSPPPVQREERQPAQGDVGMRPPAQGVQSEPAVARPRPVSRLVEQPQQSVSREQRSQEALPPSSTLSPISGVETSAPTPAPRASEDTVSRQALPTSIAAETASVTAREGPPVPQDVVRRTVGDAGEPASPEPLASPEAGDRWTEAAARQPRLATGPATQPPISRTPEEAAEQTHAQTVERSAAVPDAMVPEERVQRAPDVSLPAAANPPSVSAEGGSMRESTVAGRPPTASPEARPQLTQISSQVQQSPALSPAELSEVETGASGAHPFDTASVTPAAPLDVPPEPPAGRVDVPESAAREIRRASTPSESQATAHETAVPPVSRGAPTAMEAPDPSVDLASAYRAQLARYAAETQAPSETGEPALGRPPAASTGESGLARFSDGPIAMPGQSRTEISPSLPAPAGARVAPPSPVTSTVRRETWMTAQEPTPDAEQRLPSATYDHTRPLQRQAVRLDQALGISNVPTPPPAQPALPVRRSVTQGDTSRAESATEAPATASPTQAPAEGGPDIDELAERVFAKLRGRLRVERERLGGTRLR